MSTVAVCTSIYEAARPFLSGYLDGVRALSAVLPHPPVLVLANDGFLGPDQAFSDVAGTVHVVDGRAGGLGGVRRKMIGAALASNCEAVIFCDFDDSLLSGAANHLAVLEAADISFGDLELIDASGAVIAASFFGSADIPDCVESPSDLINHNFLGFSNTAMRREAIHAEAANIPDNQLAADWWFFSMLVESGVRAKKCQGAVAKYRQHDGSTLGARPVPTITAALLRCRLFLAHQAALPPCDARHAAAKRIEELADAITADPSFWVSILQRVCSQPGVWFDDLNAAASFL